MPRTSYCSSLILLTFICGEILHAQTTTSGLFDDRTAVERWLQETKVPVMGIGIIRNNELREVRMYGDLQKGAPAPYNALFNVASLTKPIVAMLTLKLINDGKLKLDEPLSNYWIDPDLANDPRHKKLTPRLVLTHQTGFKNWRYLEKDNKLRFDTTPGTLYGYSGEGFEYLRKAIENKFKQKLEVLTDSIIFRPLKMEDTQFAWTEDTDEKRFAHWFDEDGRQHPQDFKYSHVSAADDLITSIEDYGKFATWILKGGGLDSANFAEMVRPQTETRKRLYFGLGWEMALNLGPRKEYALIHTGSDKGVRTLCVLLPKSGQGLIVFTNSDNGNKLYEQVVTHLLDIGKELMSRAKQPYPKPAVDVCFYIARLNAIVYI